MFWGDRFGQVSDPSGHVWSLATHIKDPTPDEMAKAMADFAKHKK
jgi:PhnB protein